MIRFPTYIEFLDKKIEGFYPGLVILDEMVGAGGKEFALTYLMNYTEKESNLYYVAITKTPEEVQREISLIFPEHRSKKLTEKMETKSIAETYFRDSIVPIRWITDKKLSIKELKGGKDILSLIAEIFESFENESIVFLDSITDLARIAKERIKWNDLIDLIKGLKKLCIKKNILLLSLITAGTLEREKEEELLDQGDGVLIFEWSVRDEAINRWLYFRKFLGILPLLEREGIIKYSVKIDPEVGFTVSKLVRVI